MKLTSTILLLAFSLNAYAQELIRCATNDYIIFKSENDDSYLNRIKQVQNNIESFANNHVSRANDEILRIPVVVHVIYNNEAQNISDSRIQDQINHLNADYRRLNPDATLTRSEFVPVAADTKIEFFLSQWDPQGNPTNGITRTETDQTSFWLSMTDMKSSATGGIDAWDVNHYLNIWVCNMAIPFINQPLVLGFATPPEGAPNWPSGSSAEIPTEDGVVLHFDVVGPNPALTGTMASVNQGRTATHEIGHYLGLRHIWGDGDCAQDDGLFDTPAASAANQQTCDYAVNSCTDLSSDLPDMLENYMDYSDENCMNIFTQQQANAMRFVVENLRSNLLLSTAKHTIEDEFFDVFPNPAVAKINIVPKENLLLISKVEVLDMSGRVIINILDYYPLKIDVSSLNSGLYFLNIHTAKGIIVNKFIKQ